MYGALLAGFEAGQWSANGFCLCGEFWYGSALYDRIGDHTYFECNGPRSDLVRHFEFWSVARKYYSAIMFRVC